MDRNHTLDAPNNDELRDIEQIADRSDLSGIYREPGVQFEGELLSEEARKKVKADELEAISSGLGKSALSIGLYVPYPFIIGGLLVAGLYEAGKSQAFIPMMIAFMAIFAGGFWLITSYKAYAAIYKTFYKHAMRPGLFLFVMLISIMLATQAIYSLVAETLASQSLLFNVALMSLLVLMYSFVATFILLGIWGNSRLKSGIKAVVSGLVIIVSAFFVIATYLF